MTETWKSGASKEETEPRQLLCVMEVKKAALF